MKCYTQLEFGRNYLQACNGVQLRGLLVNFAKGKTDASLRLIGKSTRRIKMQLAHDGGIFSRAHRHCALLPPMTTT